MTIDRDETTTTIEERRSSVLLRDDRSRRNNNHNRRKTKQCWYYCATMDGPAMPWKRPPRCNAALSSGRASWGGARGRGPQRVVVVVARGRWRRGTSSGSWWRSRAGGGGEGHGEGQGWEGWAMTRRERRFKPKKASSSVRGFCSVLFCFNCLWSLSLVRSLSFWPRFCSGRSVSFQTRATWLSHWAEPFS